MIQSTTILSSIDLDKLDTTFPGTKANKFSLPNSSGAPARGLVSPDQAKSITRWMAANLSGSITFAEGLALARQRFLVGAQLDFHMCDPMLAEVRAEHASDPLTPAQERLITTLMAALSREKAHWDASVDAKIRQFAPSTRSALINRFIGCETNGQLDTVKSKFDALFGRAVKVDPPAAGESVANDGDADPFSDEPAVEV